MPKQMEVKLYPDDGWTVSKIEETLKARTSIKEYAMILHDQDVDENGAPVRTIFTSTCILGAQTGSIRMSPSGLASMSII